MKYIRTKNDTIYQVYDKVFEYKEDKRYQLVDSRFEISLNDIVKEADTIEELCDEFVFWSYGNHCIISDLETPKRYKEKYANITYGAIWTNKGLLYIAKMNNEGVLELL